MPSRRDFHKLSLAAAVAALPIAATAQSTTAAATAAPRRERPEDMPTLRPELVGTHGIVAAGRHFTVEAGTRMLAAGGNAFDAGVAAVFAAAANEISHFGLGGEAPAIVFEAASGKVTVVCGQGTAPKAATPRHFLAAGVIPGNGPNGGTVPAVVDAMALTLQHFGTMTLAQVLEPAIQLADGFPVYGLLRYSLTENQRRHRSLGMVAPHLLSRGPHSGGRRDLPPARARRHVAHARRRRTRRAREGRRSREGDRSRARCVLQGRCRPAHRHGRAGGRRAAQRRRSRHVSGATRARGHHALPGLRRAQGRLLEPGPGVADDAEHPRGRRHRSTCPTAASSTSTRWSRRSSSRSTIATRTSAIRCSPRFPPKVCCRRAMRCSAPH